MTSSASTATPSTATTATGSGARLGPAVWAVARRAVRKYRRTPQILIIAAVQSVAFLLIFRYVFGGAIGTGDLAYVDYMVPGLLTVGVMFSGMGTAVGVAEDLKQGFFDRLRSLPMPRSAVLIGRALADTAQTTWVLALTTAVAFAVGFRVHGGWLPALAALGLVVLLGFAFVWVFVALGLVTGDAQAAQGIGFLVLPLSFASSAYVPVGTMPGWLQGFAEHQPVSVVIDAVRALTQGPAAEALLGHTAGYYAVRALLWTAAIAVVSTALAVAGYRRS